jgi:ATP-dependent Clp protease adaptor protein ClpS
METKEQVGFSLDELLVEQRDLIVYNDDFNTFDHVIDSLIKICDHHPLQAEQCALIVHNNGKCQVKRGDYDVLASMCTALHECGITAEVE